MRAATALLLVSLFCTVTAATAQDTLPAPKRHLVLRLSPLGLVNKARLHAEGVLGQVGLGAIGSYYYNVAFTGAKVEPFIRFYTGQTAPEGFYLQGKMAYGSFESDFMYDRTMTVMSPNGFLQSLMIETEYGRVNRQFTSFGGGGGIGYQVLAGPQNRLALDFFLGLQFMKLPRTAGSYTEKYTTLNGDRVTIEWESDADVVWYLAGPGSVINSMISVGFAF